MQRYWRCALWFGLVMVLAGCGTPLMDMYPCWIATDHIEVFYSESEAECRTKDATQQVNGFIEVHNGEMCTWGSTAGNGYACAAVDWDNVEMWHAVRMELGISADWCVTCPSGEVICPPPMPVEGLELGLRRAMYDGD